MNTAPDPDVVEGAAWFVASALLDDTDRIRVWRCGDAPERLRALSTNGGDEDWLVYVPPRVFATFQWTPHWIDAMDSCQEPQEIALENGGRVYIASHA